MCLVAPGRVVALDGSTATLDLDGRRRQASILMEPDVRVGDWVVVAGGAVLRRIDSDIAVEMKTARAWATTPGDVDAGPTHGGPRNG
jgi:hydrogenase expression/formation protein HypC